MTWEWIPAKSCENDDGERLLRKYCYDVSLLRNKCVVAEIGDLGPMGLVEWSDVVERDHRSRLQMGRPFGARVMGMDAPDTKMGTASP